MSLLYTFFGWLTRILFGFFGNYGMAIIMLTVIIRAALIPLNIKSQKSMIKMQALSGKTAELQRKYGDDKQKYQEEVMKLQQENGAMGFSGCLLPFIQLFLIWPIYRIVSGPLIYLSQVSKENVQSMIDLATEQGFVAKRLTAELHIPLIDILNNNSDFLAECISKGYIGMGQLLDLHFLGMDLTKTPAWNPVTIISDPKTYLPLLVFPILVIITNLFSMKMATWMKPGYKEQKEAKEREKKNPARAGQTPNDQAEMTTKMMTWMMPFLMLFTTFTLPAAMGLYWVVGGIMSILTQLLTYFMFTKPYELKKLEMEQKKADAFKKDHSDDDNKKSGKKNKKRK
ncbi:MAG: YidC/Oxa1 family membrane protein insertase [Saccharofermentans sp.]|nr:YidC/Oxa1 family membrane protein insertase [Saccharofermentans sp.]